MKNMFKKLIMAIVCASSVLEVSFAQPPLTPKKMPIQPASMQVVQYISQIENNITVLSEQLNQVLGSIHDTNTADAYAPCAAQLINQIYAQILEYNKVPPPNQLSQGEIQYLCNLRSANRERIKVCGRTSKFHFDRIIQANAFLSPGLLAILSEQVSLAVFAYVACREPLQ